MANVRSCLKPTKLPHHPIAIWRWWNNLKVSPITIDMALTQRCNERCVYCYAQMQQNPGQDWTENEIKGFACDASKIGVRGISLISDGESTLSPHWQTAIQTFYLNHLSVGIGTNGIAFTPSEDTLGCLSFVRFNLSAADSDSFEKIHQIDGKHFATVLENIKGAVAYRDSHVTLPIIGLQMVLMQGDLFEKQIFRLVELGKKLGVDYVIFKHCSDDEEGTLGVDYDAIRALAPTLRKAQALSDEKTIVAVKWPKILEGKERSYKSCYGPRFHLQISGSGVVAPCGMFFSPKYKKYHIGSIHDASLQEIYDSDRYDEVMNMLCSEEFDARTMCGSLCVQHHHNELLNFMKKINTPLFCSFLEEKPLHWEFI